jgi:hypothetical protein
MKDRANRQNTEPPYTDADLREVSDQEDICIQDCSEVLDYDKLCGLSDEQVSNIANDLLNSVKYNADAARRLKRVS